MTSLKEELETRAQELLEEVEWKSASLQDYIDDHYRLVDDMQTEAARLLKEAEQLDED